MPLDADGLRSQMNRVATLLRIDAALLERLERGDRSLPSEFTEWATENLDRFSAAAHGYRSETRLIRMLLNQGGAGETRAHSIERPARAQRDIEVSELDELAEIFSNGILDRPCEELRAAAMFMGLDPPAWRSYFDRHLAHDITFQVTRERATGIVMAVRHALNVKRHDVVLGPTPDDPRDALLHKLALAELSDTPEGRAALMVGVTSPGRVRPIE